MCNLLPHSFGISKSKRRPTIPIHISTISSDVNMKFRYSIPHCVAINSANDRKLINANCQYSDCSAMGEHRDKIINRKIEYHQFPTSTHLPAPALASHFVSIILSLSRHRNYTNGRHIRRYAAPMIIIIVDKLIGIRYQWQIYIIFNHFD